MNQILQPKDATLVRRAIAGHCGSVESLVLRYQRRAHAIARAITLDPEVSQDVVQEAFLLSLEHLSSLRVPARFGPWFLQIVRNVARRALAHKRKQATAHPGERDLDVPDPIEPRDPIEAKELRVRVWGEVARLPESLREVIFLYYYHGRSVREVADTMEISTAAAKKRLQKGRELMREKLWRELETTLLDMLPAARQWKRNGRREALVLLAALPVGGALRAATEFSAAHQILTKPLIATPGPGSGASPSIVSSLQTTTLKAIGGTIMFKKALLLLGALCLILAVGASLWKLTTDADLKARTDSGMERSSARFVKRDEYDTLRARLDEAQERLRLRTTENQKLAEEIDELHLAAAAVEDLDAISTPTPPNCSVHTHMSDFWRVNMHGFAGCRLVDSTTVHRSGELASTPFERRPHGQHSAIRSPA